MCFRQASVTEGTSFLSTPFLSGTLPNVMTRYSGLFPQGPLREFSQRQVRAPSVLDLVLKASSFGVSCREHLGRI